MVALPEPHRLLQTPKQDCDYAFSACGLSNRALAGMILVPPYALLMGVAIFRAFHACNHNFDLSSRVSPLWKDKNHKAG